MDLFGRFVPSGKRCLLHAHKRSKEQVELLERSSFPRRLGVGGENKSAVQHTSVQNVFETGVKTSPLYNTRQCRISDEELIKNLILNPVGRNSAIFALLICVHPIDKK